MKRILLKLANLGPLSLFSMAVILAAVSFIASSTTAAPASRPTREFVVIEANNRYQLAVNLNAITGDWEPVGGVSVTWSPRDAEWVYALALSRKLP